MKTQEMFAKVLKSLNSFNQRLDKLESKASPKAEVDDSEAEFDFDFSAPKKPAKQSRKQSFEPKTYSVETASGKTVKLTIEEEPNGKCKPLVTIGNSKHLIGFSEGRPTCNKDQRFATAVAKVPKALAYCKAIYDAKVAELK